MRHAIALRRRLALVPAADPATADPALAAALQAELMRLGHALDADALAAAGRAPAAWVLEFHDEILPHLAATLGADRAYEPFYPDFPAGVMDRPRAELFLNATRHYLSGGAWRPVRGAADPGPALEAGRPTLLRPGTDADLLRLFTDLAGSNTPLAEHDKLALRWFARERRADLPAVMPAAIPFRETRVLLAAEGLGVPLTAPTDVLRAAAYLSGGDVSLPPVPQRVSAEPPPPPEPGWNADAFRLWHARTHAAALAARRAARDAFKFRNFSRPERRRLLGLLEATGADPADMLRHRERWLRLGERLHPGEFAARFPKSFAAFTALRRHGPGRRVRTFEGRVDLAFARGRRDGMDALAARPGAFARRLDWLLRTSDDPAGVRAALATFDAVADGVSAKVLIEMFGHFAGRARPGLADRAVFLAGRGGRLKSIPALPPMDADLSQRVGHALLGAMRRRIAALPPLGRVWIDPRLADVPVPFAMRGVNAAVKTYVRGTRVPLPDAAPVLRCYLHWLDERGDQDLDLSVGLYDADLRAAGHLSFTNLKLDALNSCHSGDVRCVAGPCAEYVDLDVARCVAAGVRWAVVVAYNYQGLPMHAVPQCAVGLTPRERPEAGATFVPRSVENAMPLANESTGVIVCALDLAGRRMIWADLPAKQAVPVIEAGGGPAGVALRALLAGARMDLARLLRLHAESRGTVAGDAASADLALRFDDFATDYAAASAWTGF